MRFDYAKLLGKITEICGTQAKFADNIGLSERTVSLKLNNRIPWKQNEIRKVCQVLQIPDAEIGLYFFTQEVQSA